MGQATGDLTADAHGQRCEPCSTRAISTALRCTRYTAMNGSGDRTSSRVFLTLPSRPRVENDESEATPSYMACATPVGSGRILLAYVADNRPEISGGFWRPANLHQELRMRFI